MRPMKRMMRLVLAAALVAGLAAPLELAGPGLPGLNTAEAATSCTTTPAPAGCGGLASPKDYICVALPVILYPTTERCPDDEGGGFKLSNDPARGGAIIAYLREILKLLSSAIILVIVLMIVISGVQYITSIADPARVKAAKDRLQNAIIALVLFMLTFAILSFLIPGGLL